MSGRISVSHGRVAYVNGFPTAYVCGSGYGSDKQLTRWTDRAAELLVSKFSLDVEKRGNSDGLSCGAHHDGPYGFGLRSCKDGDNDAVRFKAYFNAKSEDADAILAEVPNRGGFHLDADSRECALHLGNTIDYVSVYSPNYRSLGAAFRWLEKWGKKYCPTLNPGTSTGTSRSSGARHMQKKNGQGRR